MVQDHAVAIDPQVPRVQHFATVRGDDRDVGGNGQVEAKMDLLIDLLTFVEVAAMIGEAGPEAVVPLGGSGQNHLPPAYIGGITLIRAG